MSTFFDPYYYLTFFYFLVAAFIAFFIPGSVLLDKIKPSPFIRIIFSFVLGTVLFAYQGFLFGLIGVRELSYLYLVAFFIIWVKLNWKRRPKIKIDTTKKDLPIITLLICGVFVQMLFTFLNGVRVDGGLFFCCGIPDNFYHIGLTNSIVDNFPPFEPAMSGVVVKNYHYLANLVQAELIRIFKLPLIFTQYQYMSLLISLLIGLSTIGLGKILGLGRVFISFLLLFIYFFGDITYLFALINGKGLDFSAPFLYDATNLWFSPPRAFALMIFLSGTGLLSVWIKKKEFFLGLIIALMFASLVGFKIYNGFFVFFGMSSLLLYYFFKKEYRFILP